MLTKRMQYQLLADRLAGLPAKANARDFTPPLQLCWQAIEAAQSGQEQEALYNVLEGLPERKEVIESILATRPGFHPEMTSLASIAAELPPIEWIWDGWIPRGMITVLGASQGSGKSFVVTDLAWRIVHNRGFPDGAPVKRPGANIIYVDAEMVPQILNQRSQRYGMDRSKLFIMLPEPGEMIDLGKPRYQDRLSEMTAVLNPELIIIDSLSSVHTNGQNNVEDVRLLMSYLIRLAAWAGCGLVLVHHIRKPPGGAGRMMNFDMGMEDLSGTGFITQQARVVLGMHVVQTAQKFDPNGPREFKMLKNNLGKYPEPLGFHFVPICPEGVILGWDKEAPQNYREPSQLDLCKEWLMDILKDSSNGIKVKSILSYGAEQGFGRATIFRARQELSEYICNTEGRKSPDNSWKWIDENLANGDREPSVD